MSTSAIWTVHCDSSDLIGGASPKADDCEWWCSEEDTAAKAAAAARKAGWTIVSKREAYCPPCQRIREAG